MLHQSGSDGIPVLCVKGHAWCVMLCGGASLTMRFHLFNDLMWTGFNETVADSSVAAASVSTD